MSHVDDGTLHAYLDGELSPVEVEQVESHVAGCAGCRARLDEERALIERASRLLGAAVPSGPERAPPPLHQLRQPRPMLRRLRAPLAWAATIVLALGFGYYAGVGSLARPKGESQPLASAPPVQSRVDEPASNRLSKAADTEQGAGASATVTPGALADRSVREESDERKAPARQDVNSSIGQVSSAEAQTGARNAAPPTPAPAASKSVVAAPSAQAYASLDDAGRRTTVWPVIGAKPARDLLGEDPVVLPGYGVRTLRRNPGDAAEIVVEQEITNGVVVSLFERPINQGPALRLRGALTDSVAAKFRANERLARFIKGLRVEIAGPLPMDSLSKLLELIKP